MTGWSKKIGLILVCGALSACQTTGNGRAFSMDEATLTQTIKPNQSTKADVERELGKASVYQFANGYETWSYQKSVGIPRYVDYVPVLGVFTQFVGDRVTEIAFLFDPQGVLRNIDRRLIEPPPKASSQPAPAPSDAGD